MADLYEQVRAYHAEHGDDGNPLTQQIRYEVAQSLFPRKTGSVLDVGCGTGKFKEFCPGQYTGIDLLNGINVLDYTVQHDIVVALGILYRVPLPEQERLIRHMWTLATSALIVQTLSMWADHCDDGDTQADPAWLLRVGKNLSRRIVIRHDYLPHDVTLAVYR